MSHGKIREDQTCQNCNATVEHRYCSYCGQENTETRQRFHYLFTHFIEDFVHYDGSFWMTIRKLFFKPGLATKEYLNGKRNSTVNPVKLYIFVSFLTFFVLAVFPSKNDGDIKIENSVQNKVNEDIDEIEALGHLDSIQTNRIKEELRGDNQGIVIDTKDRASIQKIERDLPFLKPITNKIMQIHHRKLSNDELWRLFKSNFLSSIPKGLFFYMPLFAFVLWIFNNKKKWWYFDHGIYTLHYFSILLLSVMCITIFSRSADWINLGFVDFIFGLINTCLLIYLIYIFYKGANTLYGGRKRVNFVKLSMVLLINTFIFTFVIIGLLVYSILKI